MGTPKIAILILNWQQPNLTVNCVKSVLKSTYENFQIYLIDNHSEDNSFMIFKKEFINCRKIKLLETRENLGYAGGNNYGAREALRRYSPDYLCILNNDTLVNSNFLKFLLFAARKYGENNIYFPLIYDWKGKETLSGGTNDYLPTPFQFKYRHKKNLGFQKAEESRYLGGCCFLIKTEFFNRSNGFDENYFMYAEDIDFGIRAKKMGAKLYLVPQAKIRHRGATSFSPLSSYYSCRNTFYLIKKFFGNSYLEYLRAIFWFSFWALFQFLTLKPRISFAFLRGFISFLKNEKGGLSFYS